tara:strand:+ start:886 stop:2013 length:1128 start_codon:yes stop_codon:yes gene_type:complete
MFLRKNKEIIILLLSVFFSLFIAAIILEIYFSKSFVLSHTSSKFDPDLGWANIPGSVTIDRGKTISINSFGYRGKEVDLSKKHIVYIGDSIVFGTGVSDTETGAYLLNKKIRGYQVINLSVSGYGIDQYYLRLEKELKRLNPSMIIVNIYPGNDFGETLSGESYGYEKPVFNIDKSSLTKKSVNANFVDHRKVKLLKDKISRFSCLNQFSRFWVSRHPIFKSFKDKFCRTTRIPFSEADYLITALLMKFSVLARKHNSKLSFILSATRSDFSYKVADPEFFGIYKFLKLFSNNKTIPPAAYSSMARISFKRIFHNFKNRYNFLYPFVYYDFYDYLEKNNVPEESIFLEGDVGHLSPTGHKIMADFIIENLKSHGD